MNIQKRLGFLVAGLLFVGVAHVAAITINVQSVKTSSNVGKKEVKLVPISKFMALVDKGDLKGLRAFKVADPEQFERHINLSQRFEEVAQVSELPLVLAFNNSDLSMMRFLLEQGANPNARRGDSSVLLSAIKDNDVEVVRELLKHKNIDVNVRKRDGRNALQFAFDLGHEKIAKLLQVKGAKQDWLVSRVMRRRGVKRAISLAKILSVLGVIAMAVSPKLRSDARHLYKDITMTSFFSAVRDNNYNRAQDIFTVASPEKKKQFMHEVDVHGQTPLFYAVAHNNTNLADLLINDGADVNFITKDGLTLFFQAVDAGFPSMIKYLVGKEAANVNVGLSVGGGTPLHIAALRGASVLVKELLKAKDVNVNVQNNDGNTPLFLAYVFNQNEVFKKLLEAGADPKIKNRKGESVYDFLHSKELFIKALEKKDE